MAKLTQAQINTLNYLKAQLESSRRNPCVRPDGTINLFGHQSFMDAKAFFRSSTINVLITKGLVDSFIDSGVQVVQINNKGLEAIS